MRAGRWGSSPPASSCRSRTPSPTARDGIYDTLRAMALVHQSGGGTGFSFSAAPAQERHRALHHGRGVGSGLLHDACTTRRTDVVKQGGTRRGANMGILRVDHPDIIDFITCKDDTTKITNFNISVAVTDAFMEAVEEDGEYDLIHPKTKQAGRASSGPVRSGRRSSTAPGRPGEPGVFFIDRANHYNPVPHLGSYEATNPCGEQPLLPYDVCNLGSINVGEFVVNDGRSTGTRLRAGDPPLHPLPRERHRRQRRTRSWRSTSLAQADPPHRPRRHGHGRPADPARHPLRLRRRRSTWAARS